MYTQSAIREAHIAYFAHMYNVFKPYCSTSAQKIDKPFIKSFINKKNNNTYYSSSFATLSLKIFNPYKTLFYKNNKKMVPENICTLLTYRGLAYWIMDDGSMQNKGLHLNTYGFTDTDLDKLCKVLKIKFNLKISLHKHKKGKRIYIWENSLYCLKPHISKFFVKEMLYKIGG